MGKNKKKTHNSSGQSGKHNNNSKPPTNTATSANNNSSQQQKGFVFGSNNNEKKPNFDFSLGSNVPKFNFGGSHVAPKFQVEDDSDDEYYTDDSDDEELDEEVVKKLLFQQMLMEMGIVPPTRICPCCGEEVHDFDDEDEDDEDDEDYEDDDEDEDEDDDQEYTIYKNDNSPFGRVFDLVSKELKEKKIQSKNQAKQSVKQVKNRGVVIEDITELEAKKAVDEFIESDLVEGFFETMPENAMKSVIKAACVIISCDSCSMENSIYYRTLLNALKPLFNDVRRMRDIQELRRNSKNPKLNIRPSNPEKLKYMSDYEIHPSNIFLQLVTEKQFVPKNEQPPSECITKRKNVVQSAQSAVQSKKQRREHAEKNKKSLDSLYFDANNFADNVEFDNDPNDPETKGISDETVLERMREYKTDGARIKRITIGNWSPNCSYDGQFRIKVNPFRKSIMYTFFTYTPLYHNNFKSQQERLLHFPLLKSALTENGLKGLIFREFERLKNSVMLSMEINFQHITGIHFQKIDNIHSTIMPNPLSLLVLELNAPANVFYTRRVSCNDPSRNTWTQRNDFTTNKQASSHYRHYIMGDERELSRILAMMILSDSSKRLLNTYTTGMKAISMSSLPIRNLQTLTVKKRELADILIKTNLATLKGNLPTLNEGVFENICLRRALQFNHHTLEKLLTMPVGKLLDDVNFSVPGISKQELENLQVSQILFNEKFKSAGIYFSFCKGRFYKTMEHGHSISKGECCSITTEGCRLPSFDPKVPVVPSLNPQTNSFFTEDDKKEEESRQESYNELSSPFFFEEKNSVKFYP